MLNNIAVIVTFNKQQLLAECLQAILKQTYKIDQVIVFDNGSTDGTKEFLEKVQDQRVHSLFSEKNLGGAGGFNHAIKAAMALSPTAIWVLDDDSIVKPTALEELVKAGQKLNGNFGFLSSNVLWTDGQPCLMNIPRVAKVWNKKITTGLVKIERASFVSMYINVKAIKKLGYPISDFFIWGDDVEFSERISAHFPSYFVPKSIVIHKMKENAEVNILIDSKNRLPRYFYDIRNKFYRFKKKGKKELVKYIIQTIFLSLKVIFMHNNNKLLKLRVINKGFFAGLFFNPEVEQYQAKENDA